MNTNENKWVDFHHKAAEEAEQERQSGQRKNKTYFKMRINEAIEDKEFNTTTLYAIPGSTIEAILLDAVTLSNLGTTAQQKEACFEKMMHNFKSCKPVDDRFHTDLY